MEGWPVVLTFSKVAGHLRDLNEAAWPTMREQEGDGAVGLAPHVHEVDGELLEAVTLDGRGKLWELVETCFSFLPVETCPPMFAYPLYIAQRCSHIPSCVAKFVWVGSSSEALFEVGDVSLRKRDGKSFDAVHDVEFVRQYDRLML